MAIQESERPLTGGQWCGSAWGYTVYYSETRSLNLTLQLDRLSEQVNLFSLLNSIFYLLYMYVCMCVFVSANSFLCFKLTFRLYMKLFKNGYSLR
ncbi:hypothetical protein O3M35_001046 [Rhynocoris fuscipes]|uniref:Uncharacterized protein n=1 Tax=Rhynocoris fuscipes TaxID=488301 RepID=A0AAW1DQV8_9HEMI